MLNIAYKIDYTGQTVINKDKINHSIFRAYDIRGDASKDVTPEIAYAVGYCFAKFYLTAKNNLAYVGRDGRISSPLLFDSLTQGLVDGGAEVIYLGIVPTPLVYFADKKFSPRASFSITASHNPSRDNGFKISLEGKAFFGKKIEELKNFIISTDFASIKKREKNVKEINLNEEYVNRIIDNIKIDEKLRIAWDPGSGATCEIVKKLLEKLPNKNFPINSEPDGNFPNRSPDPTVEKNLQGLAEIILKEKCDLGIAFDGDGDRVGIMTSKGKLIGGDVLLALLSKSILAENPGSIVISDVKASSVLFSTVRKYGGKPILWKTGHVFIKDKMKETGALLAGEVSGHIFFADRYYGYDDGPYAALRLIDYLSKAHRSLDALLGELPEAYNIPEVRIKTKEEDKFLIIERIKNKVLSQGIGEVSDIDGIRVSTEEGWYLLRASNTESSIIARCEGESPEKLALLRSQLISLLKSEGFSQKDLTSLSEDD